MVWVRSTRNELARLKRRVGGAALSIPQQDGTTYSVGRDEAFGVMFDYWAECAEAAYRREPRPGPPPVLLAVAGAEDREQALERLMSGYGFLPVEVEPLVEEGEFVPRSLVAGKTYEESIGLMDLSEPGPEGDEG
jgi:hypothetical protein